MALQWHYVEIGSNLAQSNDWKSTNLKDFILLWQGGPWSSQRRARSHRVVCQQGV